MSIEKMQIANITGQVKNLDRVIERCIESKCFHIDQASNPMDTETSGFEVLHEENPYRESLTRLVSIDFGGDIGLCETDYSDIMNESLGSLSEYIDEISQKMKVLTEEIQEANKKYLQYEQIITQLKHLHGMDIDLESLIKCRHIHVRFGKLPVDSFNKLEYYGNNMFTFVHYDVDSEYYWGMYFVPAQLVKKADKIFSDLFFERIWIPEDVTGKPDKEIDELKKKFAEVKERIEKLEQGRSNLISVEGERINKVFCRIKSLYDCFELRSKVSVMKDKFYMSGFVTEKDSEKFSELINSVSGVSVILRPPDESEKSSVPVKIKTNGFTKPFSLFVEMYGLPSYGGFNPINLVAITYTLLFGIMFGDLGQGIVISVIGAILYSKTKNKLCAIMTRIGLSSAFFGLVFGSVFGFEHALDPLYKAIGFEEKPIEVMDNVNVVLGGAIAIGVVLIIISILINIVTSLKKKEYDIAVFGNNGITGLVFFSAIMYAAVSMLIFEKNVFTPIFAIFLIVLPLVIMLFREPLGCLMSGKKFKSEGIGDFIASNFFEVFEFVLGYVTNTLSFVRIGGFVLSHAAMMSVVMLLSEMYEGASPVIVILGNIFVIGMEGMLSGIQVLRLEFYEIFSRCYDGDGIAFEPVSVSYSPEFE
ncbi:MAG: V-type ATPase 116kDa subunit family protein [Oscillospiraceae bacterium]|nr:V-type ATPase 116kDa subunit family protein [Oscillospiraceae bacterium]